MLDRPTLILREAAAKPNSWNADTRTIAAVIASNAPVARRDATGDYLEILDPQGADLSGLIGASVLDGHNNAGVRSVIGTVEDAAVEGTEIVARLRMSSRPELIDVVRDIAEGVIRHLSVGYSVSEWRDGSQDGKRTRTAVKWMPREVSFVAVPADRNAHTRGSNMSTTERPAINRSIRDLATRAGVAAAITDDLIDRQASIDEARQAILDDVIKRGSVKISSSSNRATLDDPEFFRSTVADALYTRVEPSHKPSGAAEQFVGLSMSEVARACLHRAGISTFGMGADRLITRALAPEATSDYPAIMMNVLNKSLRVAYQAAPSGLKEVARETANVDFRAKWRIMLDSTGIVLQPVGEAGEFKKTSMLDGAESYSVATYGDIFTISRQALINDDLNAFGDISRRLGIACAMFEAQVLVNFLLQNSSQGPTMAQDGHFLFHALHNNYLAVGAGAAVSVDTVSAARKAMRLQTGIGGGLIAVKPRYLIVGADQERPASNF
jgi:Caudovirus prohead serine protease